ncbi:MAG TPA: hypothetical protein PLQ00_05255 [Thermoguttaceae bacterium]|nr:hypothetical protein [Thermoguttaceae bacterium]
MYQIDFLPEEYRYRRAVHRQQLRRLILLAFAAGAMAGLSFLLHVHRLRLEGQLDLIQPVHTSLAAQNKQLHTLQTHLQTVRSMAELLAYLRHPWPRTQILVQLFQPLPGALILEQVTIDRQMPENQPPQRPLSRSEQEAEKARLAAMAPPSRDLHRFRRECDPMQTVVRLSGVALEATALHQYLAALEKADLFTKVQLMNLEKSGDQEGLRFQVRLIVRPGYGQAGGPKASGSSSAVGGPPALPSSAPKPGQTSYDFPAVPLPQYGDFDILPPSDGFQSVRFPPSWPFGRSSVAPPSRKSNLGLGFAYFLYTSQLFCIAHFDDLENLP